MLALIPRPRSRPPPRIRTSAGCTTTAIAALDDARMARNTWWMAQFPQHASQVIAYFSAEFALHQSLPIYAGGLGVLAGDHCKEAGDLGVPLIGVGFMYPQGYFHQHISADGWQEESYERLNWADAPIEPAMTPRRPAVRDGGAARRSIGAGGGLARAHRPREAVPARHRPRGKRAVGSRALGAALRRRSRNADPAGNHARHRRRAGAEGARIGAGGVSPQRRATPAFVVLQRIRDLIERGSTFDQALEEIRATTVFTTHTPVPAGHDAFPFHLVEKHLAGCWGTLGANREQFLALGSHDTGGGAQFNMTALALRSAGAINAVSQLHGEVTREHVGVDLARRRRNRTAGRRGDQRRARADLDCERSRRVCSPAISAPTGSTATTTRRCGTACWRFPTRSCGRSGRR